MTPHPDRARPSAAARLVGVRSRLPERWSPWRSPSPLGAHKPRKEDLATAARSELGRQDVLPYPVDTQCAGLLRLLVVGINPGLWTAAVNAPFARPGNRFWTSLQLAGLTEDVVDASRGLSGADERMLAERGIGITNIVRRATARADELTAAELRAGAALLVDRVRVLRPTAVAVTGVTAFRTAFADPRAAIGAQRPQDIAGWPADVQLWVLPNPSGLNAHENARSLADKWREVWAASAD